MITKCPLEREAELRAACRGLGAGCAPSGPIRGAHGPPLFAAQEVFLHQGPLGGLVFS